MKYKYLKFKSWLKYLLLLCCALMFSFMTKAQSVSNNSQWGKNGKASAVEDPVLWANGNAQEQNSHFAEGQSIATRIEMTGLTPLVQASVSFSINIIQGNNQEHAFDFFTGAQRITEIVNPLSSGVIAADYNTVSYFAFPIPDATSAPGVPPNYYDATAIKMTCQQNADGGLGVANAQNSLWFYNCTVQSITYQWGNEEGTSTQLAIATVKFTPLAGKTKVLFALGCHIAAEETNYGCSGWGTGQGATAIGGSPYHFHIIDICQPTNNCITLGSQDQQMATSAVVPPTCDLIVIPSQSNVSCNGGTNGSITLGISGTSTYSVSWTGPSSGSIVNLTGTSTQTITGLAAGTYSITVSDDNNVDCFFGTLITIIEPAVVTLSLTKTDALCNGSANGKVQATFGGGTSPYQVKIDAGGFSTQTSVYEFTGLLAGTHTVTVQDANLCSKTMTIDVGEPAVVTLSLTKTDALCNGSANGKVQATFGGGTSPYQVKIDAGGFSTQTSVYEFTGLLAGTHTVTVQDANLCSKTMTIVVGEPAVVTLSLTKTDALCNGSANGKVQATFGGGTSPYQVKIDAGGFSTQTSVYEFTGLLAGTHTVTVQDANLCSKTMTIDVGEPAVVTLSLTKTDALCNGSANGKVQATFGGGTSPYQVKIDAGGFSTQTSVYEFTGLLAGTHTVTIQDANLCSKTMTIDVGEPAVVTLSLTKTDALCNGSANGKVQATFGGGTSPYQVKIDAGGFSTQTSVYEFTGLLAGTHTVTVQDANLCSKTMTIVVGEPAVVTLSLTKTDALCNGSANGKVQATFGGGTSPYQVKIDAGGFSTQTSVYEFTGLLAGTHTVTVQDANLCSKTMTIDVGEPAVVTLSLTKTDALCNGSANGKVQATFGGGTSPYQVKIDAGGFSTQTSVYEFTGLLAGTHTVTVQDANLCSKTMTIVVGEPAVVTCYITPTAADCGMTNGTAMVTAVGGTPGYSYEWIGQGTYSATTQSIDNLVAGTYTVTVTDANGCQSTCAVEVAQTPCYWNCDTAYGKAAANSYCFLNDGFNNWGWTNYIGTATSTTFGLYAGAAGCNATPDKLVGSVLVTYVGGTVTVSYNITNPDYYMTEVHIYLGTDQYPQVKQGKKTVSSVSPGQYTWNAGSLDYVTTYTKSFTGQTGNLWVIAHAVTCKQAPAPIVDQAIVDQTKVAQITDGFDASALKVYPNPFTDKVYFEFVSGKDTHAVLEITNILGQKIKTLIDGPVKAGVMNRVEYQPENMVSGILIYRLILDGNVQNGRVVYKK